MADLTPCPFCGHVGVVYVLCDGGYKWGAAACAGCGAQGPEVRTQYDDGPDATWHADALEEWNTRACPRCRKPTPPGSVHTCSPQTPGKD